MDIVESRERTHLSVCASSPLGSGHHARSQATFFALSAGLFAASATVTVVWCSSMSTMGSMPMPGGWTMSMAWMRMPGQTWLSASASFVVMWVIMMKAMMLPSLAPMLWRYREAVTPTRGMSLGKLTMLVGAGYFFVWALCGVLVYPLGVSLATLAMQCPALARTVPVASGTVVVIAGALQFTTWKIRHLACCRSAPHCRRALEPRAAAAWQHGLRLGKHCVFSSAGATAILLVIGVMDLRAMAVVTAAISLERLGPSGNRTARAIGVIAIIAGLLILTRALEPASMHLS
jgi:predicted metal-binding membrane protein